MCMSEKPKLEIGPGWTPNEGIGREMSMKIHMTMGATIGMEQWTNVGNWATIGMEQQEQQEYGTDQ